MAALHSALGTVPKKIQTRQKEIGRKQQESSGKKMYGSKLHGNRDVWAERTQWREMFNSLSMHESLQNRKE